MTKYYSCVLYVSEGLRLDVIRRIQENLPVFHHFVDPVYNRTSFVFQGSNIRSCVDDIVSLYQRAINLFVFLTFLKVNI